MSETTDTATVPGTRGAAELLLATAAAVLGQLDEDTATEAEAAAGFTVAGHLAEVASVHAQLAIEARLGEVVDHLAEVARLLRPRSVDLGAGGIVHNAHGLSAEDIDAAYARAEAIAHARQTGQTPAAGR